MALTRLGLNQSINLATNTTGTLGVANGGTGLTSGTTDQILKFTGSTTLASAAEAAGGKILQVQGRTVTGERNTNSTSNVATNIHDSITPSATSSKILVLISLPSVYASNRTRPTRITIRRHTSTVSVGGAEQAGASEVSGDFHMNYMGGSDQQVGRSEYNFLDSPNTTSEIFYQVFFSSHNSDNTSYIGQSSVPNSHITLLEVDGS